MKPSALLGVVLPSVALCACGGSSRSSTKAASAHAQSTAAASTLCQNPTECSTQTTRRPVTDVTISDPSNAHEVMDALHGDYNAQLQQADQATGFAMVRSLCAPVGSTGQFATDDYMCAAIVVSTSTGQQSYGAPILFNVRSDGTVYAVGAPCTESTPARRCTGNYWNLVLQQWQGAAFTPAPATTTTAAAQATSSSPAAASAPSAGPAPDPQAHEIGLGCQVVAEGGTWGSTVEPGVPLTRNSSCAGMQELLDYFLGKPTTGTCSQLSSTVVQCHDPGGFVQTASKM